MIPQVAESRSISVVAAGAVAVAVDVVLLHDSDGLEARVGGVGEDHACFQAGEEVADDLLVDPLS